MMHTGKFSLLGICLAGSLALGQETTVSPDALRLAASPAPAVPMADAASNAVGLSLYWENDGNFAKLNGATDRHYSAGVGTAIQWQNPFTSDLVGALPSINGEFARETPGTSFSMGLLLSLNIYTPENISDREPIFNDHPYAGWTYFGLIVQRANRAADIPVYEHFELDLGTIGPSGQAGKVQKWVHNTFNFTKPEGWDNQIREEFGADFKYLRRWRFDLLNLPSSTQPMLQLIPEAGATLGTMHINATAGAILRFGWNLPDDFGPGRMRYASDYTRPFTPSNNANYRGAFGAYVFLRPGMHAVVHDSTIEGSYFTNSLVEATARPFTYEIQGGIAIQFLKYCEFTYSQTATSPEFYGQENHDSYGTLTLTFTYTW